MPLFDLHARITVTIKIVTLPVAWWYSVALWVRAYIGVFEYNFFCANLGRGLLEDKNFKVATFFGENLNFPRNLKI